MPRAGYMPTMDGVGEGLGDWPNPLMALQRNRHHTVIQFREGKPLDEAGRSHLLSRHCSRRGRRHDFAIKHRDGRACLWCGLVTAELD